MSIGFVPEALRRVLVVHPAMRVHGGVHATAMWVLQALRGVADVTLLTWSALDLDELNAIYGTSLGPGDFRVAVVPPALRPLERVPQAYLLRASILLRLCRRLDRRHPYDVLFSTFNEADFGRRGLQYVQAPDTLLPPSRARSYPAALGHALYASACAAIAGRPRSGVAGNATLVNSHYMAGRVRAALGVAPIVLHPPVPGGFPDVPWHEREDALVCVGRFHASKRLLEAIDVAARLRARGHATRLTIVGTPHDRAYEARVRAAAARLGGVAVHSLLPRAALVRLVASHRYAIHAMEGEHFGIVVAEYLRAGCIPFVHAEGGPAEIVADPELTFGSVDDAVERIDRVLGDERTQRTKLESLRVRRDVYSESRFLRELPEIVARFAAA